MEERSRVALVVHDLDDIRQDLSTIVASFGFEVTQEASFKAALAALTSRVDLLVAHVQLREYNGLHLVLRAKTRHPDAVMVVLSNTSDRVLLREAEALGADFVVDSSSHSEFIAALRRLVGMELPARSRRQTRGRTHPRPR